MWPLYDKRGLPWPLFDKQGRPRTWVVIPLFVFMTAAYILVAIAVTLYFGLAYAAIYWILSGVFLFFLAGGLFIFLMKRRQEAKTRLFPAGRALPIWRDRRFGMRTSPRIPPNRKQVRNYVVSVMIGVIAGSAGWIVVMRSSLLEAALLLICAPSVVLIVVAIAILTAPKEWRKAMLAKDR